MGGLRRLIFIGLWLGRCRYRGYGGVELGGIWG
jgi:hypothetical protein